MNRNIFLLALSQAAMMTTISLVLSSSAWVGAHLSSPNFATLPLASQYLGTLAMLYPAARLMERYGRRFTFCGGALLGTIGLACAALGVRLGNFALFAAAGFLIGGFGAVGQYYRFAAIDSVAAERKSLAISWTLSGGLLAAVAGPTLARWTKDALDPPFFASFLALTGIALLAAVLALGLSLPPMARVENEQTQRSWSEIARHPKLLMAILGSVVGYAMMNLLMTATPLAMMCSRLGFAQTAEVIQWHVVAMFAPSFFAGALIQRCGILLVMLLGCLLHLGSIALTQMGNELLHFEAALILLGIGWNFLYIGATALLTESCRKEEAARVQALNDTLVFLGVTAATLFSGALVNALGWQRLNIYAGLPILAVMTGLIRLMNRPRISGLRAIRRPRNSPP
ncbi:MAG: MFS transporter [Azonexus sp.]|jgi:MFS family permease|uniref:MFS transporter n=1 Tax=Azonexus sp. TaxID=1872668 RepID=UPI002829D422|nr:MFS transporter [Azonexus sp.]MDR0776928.1 MFS transporter [Azonexus sp.]